ncbi:hypothetical protein AGMMS49928_03450 [Spirochaetia bacterium]|nr:hypothetical protein AGMMS49928_03450 [Spirochaetia bacterium]
MKQVKKFFGKAWLLPSLALMFCLAGCTGNAPAQKTIAAGPIIGPEWFLAEIRTPEKVIPIDRAKLEDDNMGGFFTLRFEGETLAIGQGAPNRYRAPCSWGDDNTLEIGPAAATLMMAVKEPESLKEHEFFNYLARVKRYKLIEGRLELYARDSENAPWTILVFEKD